jgi:hypothetical protein
MGWKEEYKHFKDEFSKESDRAAVILAAAKIDELLRLAIIKRLAPSPTNRDDLLEPEGPLGTLRSRIDIAYRLNLIDSAFARALHLIRRIRNNFAHELSGASLSSGAHSDRVRELALPWQKIIEKIHELQPELEHNTVRSQFEFMVGYTLVRLNQIVKHCDQVSTLPHPLGIFMEPVKEPDLD